MLLTPLFAFGNLFFACCQMLKWNKEKIEKNGVGSYFAINTLLYLFKMIRLSLISFFLKFFLLRKMKKFQ